jgi:hypothetical protein
MPSPEPVLAKRPRIFCQHFYSTSRLDGKETTSIALLAEKMRLNGKLHFLYRSRWLPSVSADCAKFSDRTRGLLVDTPDLGSPRLRTNAIQALYDMALFTRSGLPQHYFNRPG